MYKITDGDLKAVIDNGRDIDMTRISGCGSPNLDWCEAHCTKYYDCETVAYANDILVACERGITS